MAHMSVLDRDLILMQSTNHAVSGGSRGERTDSTVDGVGVIGHGTGIDQRVDASQGKRSMTAHSPEGLASGRNHQDYSHDGEEVELEGDHDC